MPKNHQKQLKKYLRSKIYIIKSPSTDLYYVGSTTTSLKVRFNKHKSAYRVYKKKLQNPDLLIGGAKKCASFEILNFEDAYIEKLELVKCNTREELYKREAEIIYEHKLNNNKIVNKVIPSVVQKQELHKD